LSRGYDASQGGGCNGLGTSVKSSLPDLHKLSPSFQVAWAESAEPSCLGRVGRPVQASERRYPRSRPASGPGRVGRVGRAEPLRSSRLGRATHPKAEQSSRGRVAQARPSNPCRVSGGELPGSTWSARHALCLAYRAGMRVRAVAELALSRPGSGRLLLESYRVEMHRQSCPDPKVGSGWSVLAEALLGERSPGKCSVWPSPEVEVEDPRSGAVA
jgi:hypothetical protein